MKKSLIFVVGIFLLLNLNGVYAGNEIIDYTTQIIYDDCKGQDINAPALGLVNTSTNQPIPTIKWTGNDYNPPLRRVIELIIENEPYSVYVGGGQGDNLLNCGDKSLTANFYTYKWKGERIDPFIYNFNQIVNQVINQIANMQGSYKPQVSQAVGQNITTNQEQYNLFSDNNFYLTIGFSVGVSLVSIAIFEIVLWQWKRRKKKETK